MDVVNGDACVALKSSNDETVANKDAVDGVVSSRNKNKGVLFRKRVKKHPLKNHTALKREVVQAFCRDDALVEAPLRWNGAIVLLCGDVSCVMSDLQVDEKMEK